MLREYNVARSCFFVEVPRYLGTLWLVFYFLRQPQRFRSQTKQTLAVEDNAHQHATIVPTATSSYGTSTRMGYLCAALSEATCTCRLAAATLLRNRSTSMPSCETARRSTGTNGRFLPSIRLRHLQVGEDKRATG